MHKSRVPIVANILIDSCAFDPQFEPEKSAARALLDLCTQLDIALILPHSTKTEIEHPRTPAEKRRRSHEHIYTIETALTADEERKLAQIHRVLAGNGKPENVAADARHIFEAQKYGFAFVTTDKVILKRRAAIADLCNVAILLPSEMLARLRDTLDEWSAEHGTEGRRAERGGRTP